MGSQWMAPLCLIWLTSTDPNPEPSYQLPQDPQIGRVQETRIRQDSWAFSIVSGGGGLLGNTESLLARGQGKADSQPVYTRLVKMLNDFCTVGK